MGQESHRLDGDGCPMIYRVAEARNKCMSSLYALYSRGSFDKESNTPAYIQRNHRVLEPVHHVPSMQSYSS